MYGWQEAELEKLSLSSLLIVEARLEKRRNQLIAKLPFDGEIENTSTDGVDQTIIDEWLALLTERDTVAKLKVDKANQEEFSECLSQLRSALKRANEFHNSHDMPAALKKGITSLLAETTSFLASNSHDDHLLPPPSPPAPPALPTPRPSRGTPSRGTPSRGEGDCTIDMESPNGHTEIKPFTPLKLPDFSKLKQQTPRSAAKKIEARSVTPGRKSSRKIAASSTPKATSGAAAKITRTPGRTPRTVEVMRNKELDLRKSLLKSKNKLRQTPGVKRSPGGTPSKKERVFNLGNPSDLVTYALRKKFQNVRKLYASPNADADKSINISID